MPQPVVAGGLRPVCQFGGRALPIVGTTLGYIDLNDHKNWWLEWTSAGLDVSNASRQASTVPLVFRAKGVYLSDDFGPRLIKLTQKYYEGAEYGGVVKPLGAALSQLRQAGEQFLTFDNLTAIPVKFLADSNRRSARIAPGALPFWWDLQLEFLAVTPWFSDLTPTVPVGSPWAVSGSVSPGTSTGFNITYAGSVFAEPVFTLNVPAGNTVVINSLVLTNTTSGEALTIAFPGGLLANTAYTITIDCGAWTVKDGTGKQYDVGGSFPQLYPPAGQVNAFTAVIVTATGTTTSVTLGASVTARWEL